MRLEGSLDAFSLPDIFALLSMTKKTGGLHLRRSHAHGVVWFTTGSLTGGASDVSRQSLARRVVGSMNVDADALERAVNESVGNDGLGVVRALQQANVVDEGVLVDLVGEHVVDTVFDLLRWPDGDFAFVVDEVNPDDVGVSRQVDDVVTEARRRLEAWKTVAAAIPSPAAVLTVPAVLASDPQLSRDEWALLALVDGRRTVAQIVGLAGRGEFSVVSALAELVGRGLLRVDDADHVPALLRSHDLLATLETGVVAEPPAPVAPEPVAKAAPAAPEPTVVDEEEPEDDEDEDVAEPAAAPTLTAVPSQPRAEITPKRPEPFLPKRQPEHPEEPMPAVAAVAGGAASAAPAAATYIERDPSVNKSLLLRLIAGVRGL
ncbi:MAG TPA: DUF4388 domain-containing protein [Mycobacteriales bacterium]|nr:DUF4388 domain-containing protein [Mycobacteriales bacterium]